MSREEVEWSIVDGFIPGLSYGGCDQCLQEVFGSPDGEGEHQGVQKMCFEPEYPVQSEIEKSVSGSESSGDDTQRESDSDSGLSDLYKEYKSEQEEIPEQIDRTILDEEFEELSMVELEVNYSYVSEGEEDRSKSEDHKQVGSSRQEGIIFDNTEVRQMLDEINKANKAKKSAMLKELKAAAAAGNLGAQQVLDAREEDNKAKKAEYQREYMKNLRTEEEAGNLEARMRMARFRKTKAKYQRVYQKALRTAAGDNR